METWETVTMSRKEAPRAGLVKAALAGQIPNVQAAHALRISLRQFRRLKARFRAAGVRGLVQLVPLCRHSMAAISPARPAATPHPPWKLGSVPQSPTLTIDLDT